MAQLGSCDYYGIPHEYSAMTCKHWQPAAPAPQAEGTSGVNLLDSKVATPLTPEQLWENWIPPTETERLFSDKKVLHIMFQFTAEYAKLTGAAPAETARWTPEITVSHGAPPGVASPFNSGETAGEMTADITINDGAIVISRIEHCEGIAAKLLLLRNFGERYAKQRVEQAERPWYEVEARYIHDKLMAAVEIRGLRDQVDALAEKLEELIKGANALAELAEAKVADLERERDTARETSKELNRRNGALQHTLNTLTDRNVWYGYYKAAMSLFGWEEDKRKAAESELREMREALELAQKWLVNCLPTVVLDGTNPLPVIARLLARKAGS